MFILSSDMNNLINTRYIKQIKIKYNPYVHDMRDSTIYAVMDGEKKWVELASDLIDYEADDIIKNLMSAFKTLKNADNYTIEMSHLIDEVREKILRGYNYER